MIQSPRLKIIPCDDTIFEAFKMGDNVLARVIGANVPKKWTGFRNAFAPAYLRWLEHPPLRDWWMHLLIYVPDNLLIGSCGYKGEPDENGTVEIGYEIKESFRGKGLATEAAIALSRNALAAKEVRQVIAHTVPYENPSAAVLRKAGFEKESEVADETEGLMWRWRLTN